MRAVLDTNILARPIYNDAGPAAELLRRLSRSPHVLVISSHIITELHRVLRYEHLRKVHGRSDDEIDQYVADIATAAVLVDPQPDDVLTVVPSDPDDDLVIATAVVAQAEALCTLDRHIHHPDVRDYCAQHGIDVLTDTELLAILRAAGPH